MFAKILRETIRTTGMVLFMLVAAGLFSRFVLLSGLTDLLSSTVAALQLNRYVVYFFVVVVYLIMGCFISATGMIVITLPIFHPLMMSLGFNSIWFGVIVVTLTEVAVITPPVGMNAFVTHSLVPDIPLSTVFKGCSYFVVADLVRLLILTVFPGLVLFLPSMM